MHHGAEVILHPASRGQEPAVAVGEVRALSERKYFLPTKNTLVSERPNLMYEDVPILSINISVPISSNNDISFFGK